MDILNHFNAYSPQEHCMYQTTCAYLTNQLTSNRIQQKDIMIPYMTQPRYTLNNQFLTIFFAPAAIPARPLYPEFNDRYSPQYGKLSFSLNFMTNTLFFEVPSPTCKSFLDHTVGLITCMLPSMIPLTEF